MPTFSFDYRLIYVACDQSILKNIPHQYFSICFGLPPRDHFYPLVEFFGLLYLNEPTINQLDYNQDSAVAMTFNNPSSCFSFKYCLTTLAVCLGSLSCWNTNRSPINLVPQTKTCSFKIFK